MIKRLQRFFKPRRGVELNVVDKGYELLVWKNKEAEILYIPDECLKEIALMLNNLKGKKAQLNIKYGYYSQFMDLPSWAMPNARRLIVNKALETLATLDEE